MFSISGKIKSVTARTKAFAKRWQDNVSGVAAIEFAMVAPLLLMLFIGSVEFSQGLTLDRRVTTSASSIADLIAQTESISNPELNDIMEIGDALLETALISQYNPNKLQIEVVSVVTDANNEATVDWSYNKSGGEPYAPGSAYPDMPSGLLEPLSSVIVAKVTYGFTPDLGHFITGEMDLEETFYLRPRRSLKVTKE